MNNGMLYFVGKNDYGFFGFDLVVTIPTMIPKFWNINDSIVDIWISKFMIYFLSKNGILYGCGNNVYKNISDNSLSFIINPQQVNPQLWGGSQIQAFGSFDYTLFISTGSYIIGIGSITSSKWSVIYTLPNINKMVFLSNSYHIFQNTIGDYYYGLTKINVPYNEKVTSLSIAYDPSSARIGSIVLTNTGSVYVNTTITTNYSTSNLVTPNWNTSNYTDNIVKVSVGVYGTNTYYTYLTKSGKAFASGDNSWNQISHLTTNNVSTPQEIKIPLATDNKAKVIDLFTTNFGNIIAMTSPCENHYEFDGNRGEFIKYDAGFSINAKMLSIAIKPLYTYTVHKHTVNIKIYATDSDDVMNNRYIPWTKLMEDNKVISSVSKQIL